MITLTLTPKELQLLYAQFNVAETAEVALLQRKVFEALHEYEATLPPNEDKPRRVETSCPLCRDEAVALYTNDRHSVVWCVRGHVCANDPLAKLVYDFNWSAPKEPGE